MGTTAGYLFTELLLERTIQQPRITPSLAQLWNAIRVYAGLAYSRLVRQPYLWGSPLMLMIEPGTACQLHCPHCPTGRGELTRPAGRMTFERFRKIWESIRPAPYLLQLWNQGEPLMNRELAEIIRLAAGDGALVSVATNAELLENPELATSLVQSGLYELILSLDGATEESHAAYRVGGSFRKVEKGIRNMVAAKKEMAAKYPLLTWQYLLFRHNLNEIEIARKKARLWGVNRIVFKTAQLESFEQEEGETWLPEQPGYRRYDLVGEKWVLRRKPNFFCNRIYTSAVIQWDGTVVPCCFDKDGEFVMGNAEHEGFPAVWNSRKYREFRENWIKGVRPLMCGNCTEGLKNLYVIP